MSDATTGEPNLDPEEGEARLDELEQNIAATRRQAVEHGTIPAADDGEQRFLDDGDVDDRANTQGVAPPA